jgi:iron-regulated transporter 1
MVMYGSHSENKIITDCFKMQVLRTWLGLQNLSFVVAGGAVSVLLSYSKSTIGMPTFIALVIIVNISGAIGALATLAGVILIERDWLVSNSNCDNNAKKC